MAKSTRSTFGNRMSNLHQVAATAAWEKGDDSIYWPSMPAAAAAKGEMQLGENSKDIFLQIIHSLLFLYSSDVQEPQWVELNVVERVHGAFIQKQLKPRP